MKNLKEQFIKLAFDSGALKFGQFKLKSGRISPYFFNAGLINRGPGLYLLGQLYANALISSHTEFEHLFGPAYKGLPLATATGIALAEMGMDISVTFNRKEAKSHGEGGQLIGAPLSGKTVIVDDVITAGTAFRESKLLIEQAGGKVSGVLIALDRCERGQDKTSTIDEIKSQGIQVISLVTIFDLIEFLEQEGDTAHIGSLKTYLKKYQSTDS